MMTCNQKFSIKKKIENVLHQNNNSKRIFRKIRGHEDVLCWERFEPKAVLLLAPAILLELANGQPINWRQL